MHTIFTFSVTWARRLLLSISYCEHDYILDSSISHCRPYATAVVTVPIAFEARYLTASLPQCYRVQSDVFSYRLGIASFPGAEERPGNEAKVG